MSALLINVHNTFERGYMGNPVYFRWDANPEEDIAEYKLYAGRQSGVYTANGSPKSMGNVTKGTFNCNESGKWFFALTVVKTNGLESSFSAEIASQFLVV